MQKAREDAQDSGSLFGLPELMPKKPFLCSAQDVGLALCCLPSIAKLIIVTFDDQPPLILYHLSHGVSPIWEERSFVWSCDVVMRHRREFICPLYRVFYEKCEIEMT